MSKVLAANPCAEVLLDLYDPADEYRAGCETLGVQPLLTPLGVPDHRSDHARWVKESCVPFGYVREPLVNPVAIIDSLVTVTKPVEYINVRLLVGTTDGIHPPYDPSAKE